MKESSVACPKYKEAAVTQENQIKLLFVLAERTIS